MEPWLCPRPEEAQSPSQICSSEPNLALQFPQILQPVDNGDVQKMIKQNNDRTLQFSHIFAYGTTLHTSQTHPVDNIEAPPILNILLPFIRIASNHPINYIYTTALSVTPIFSSFKNTTFLLSG